MRFISFAIIAAVFMLIAGCQAGNMEINRSSSAATCAQDVLNAWNDNCSDYNFNPGSLVDAVTVGSLYNGTDFATDSAGLKQAMQNQLMSMSSYDPWDIEDLLNEVIEDDCWY